MKADLFVALGCLLLMVNGICLVTAICYKEPKWYWVVGVVASVVCIVAGIKLQ